MTIHKPALFVYSLGSRDAPQDRDANYLRERWVRCRQITPAGFGLTLPAPNIAASADFPGQMDLAESSFRCVSGALSGESKTNSAAYGFEYLDSTGVCLCLSPDNGNTRWRALAAQWSQVWNPAPEPPCFGEVLVFYGLRAPVAQSSEEREALARELPPECRLSEVPDIFGAIHVWDAGHIGLRRVIGVTAPESDDRAATEYCFWKDSSALAAFPRFFLHAGKVEYSIRLYSQEAPKFRALQKKLDGELGTLLNLEKRAGIDDAAISALLRAQRALSRSEADSAGLTISISLIREMKQSVRIARRNLFRLALQQTEAAETAWPQRRTCPVSFSATHRKAIEQCRWLEQQLTAELTYLLALRERARAMFRTTAMRIAEAKQAATRRQHFLDLMQTIMLGALLICLDAMHALHVDLPPELHPLEWPIIAVLMSLAFALPPLFLHWRERYGKLEYIAVLLTGASASWLLMKANEGSINRWPHPRVWSAAMPTLLIVICAALVSLRVRFQNSDKAPDKAVL